MRVSLVLGVAAAVAVGILGAPAFKGAPSLETAIAKVRTAMAEVAASDSGGQSPGDEAAYDGNRIIIVDGDTVALPCAVPSPGCAEKLRLLSIDTPETWRPTCEAERIAGLRAKERLAQLLRGGTVTVERDGRDRYGRTLGTVRTAEGDVGSILVAEGWRCLIGRELPQRKNEFDTGADNLTFGVTAAVVAGRVRRLPSPLPRRLS